MAAGSADGFFRHVYDGCLSGGDMGIDRRPYHRNCRCALHKSKENCPHALPRWKSTSTPSHQRRLSHDLEDKLAL
ncbi:hypothetical protein POTOM_056395 [Populus tomentosa]|uniref:Uncharacterized protein n=1 Tax=Populus tomentosa TaxID=118781 RepID=A0A8X7XZ03_POPTO|nr:hypothetical protein POTOM_056395 [Populus tomentosa]